MANEFVVKNALLTPYIGVSGSITAASAIARGSYFNNTLVAASNNDTLIGLDIKPTFTNGAYTGVTNYALRISGASIINATSDSFLSQSYVNYSDTYHNHISFFKSNGTTKTVTLGDNGSSVAYPFITGMLANYGFVGNSNSGFHIYAGSSVNATFFTNGNVGINTTTDASYKLDVNGSGASAGALRVTGGNVQFGSSTGLNWDNTNSRLGIGTNAPSNPLHIKTSSRFGFLYECTDDTANGNYLFLYRNSATPATNDIIGTILLEGNNASLVRSTYAYFGARILATTASAHSAEMYFNTTNAGTEADKLVIKNTGNVIIQNGGTFTDAGYRLDVNGAGASTGALRVTGGISLIQGGGNTSATNALSVQNSDATNILRVRNDNKVLITQLGFGNDFPEIFCTSTGVFDVNGGSLSFTASQTNYGVASYNFYFRHVYSGRINTSGTSGGILQNLGFSPTSGTGTFNQIALTGAINQTGGANGITRGLYINPTLTAAADWRSLEWSNNSGYGIYGAGTASNYVAGNFGFQQTSPTAIVDIGASTTSKASLRIRSGTAPTTPNDGDIWYDGTDFYGRVGSTSKSFTAGGGGGVTVSSYTPTVTTITNVSSATIDHSSVYYISYNGEAYEVWGQVTMTPTAALTTTGFRITLPVLSGGGVYPEILSGSFTSSDGAVGRIYFGYPTDAAYFESVPPSTISRTYSFRFIYKVIPL